MVNNGDHEVPMAGLTRRGVTLQNPDRGGSRGGAARTGALVPQRRA